VSGAWAVYLGAAVLGEIALPFAPTATALIDVAVLVTSLTHFGWAQRSPIALGDPSIRVLPAVALVPLLRLLSLTLPVPDIDPIFWVAASAGPLLLAVLASARLAHMDVAEMSLTRVARDRVSALIVIGSLPAGIGLGMAAPSPIVWGQQAPIAASFVAAILVAGAAIPEELIFRGVLQPLLTDLMGRAAPALAALVFAATYIGTESPVFVLVMAGIGLVYGWNVRRSGSLWPAIAAHAVLILSQVFLVPALQ
jgi:membrane protease YdiL (CAAX protease family)